MNTPLSPAMAAVVDGCRGSTNWGKKAKKKIVSFGFSRLISTASPMTRRSDLGAAFSSTVSGVRSRRVRQARKSR